MFRSFISATTTPPPFIEENTSSSPVCLKKGDGHDGDVNLEDVSLPEDNLSFLTDPMVRSETQEASTSQTTTNRSCPETPDHSRIKAYKESLRNAFALDPSKVKSKVKSKSSVPTKKMVNVHDIMISEGSLTYDNIIVDPEEQQQNQADKQHLEQVAQTTSTLEDREDSLGYLVEALDLEKDCESLNSRASRPPQDLSLSFHASQMTTSSEELDLGDSISTTMSTGGDLIVDQETPWTFNESVMDDVTSTIPAEQEHGLDVLMHVGNQLLLEETVTVSPTTPMHARRFNKSWTWIVASLLFVVLGTFIFLTSFQSKSVVNVPQEHVIFLPSFQSKSVVNVQQDVPPTEWHQAYKKNSSVFILKDAPKEIESIVVASQLESTTNFKERQIDQERVQDKSQSSSRSWITAALGFLVMWMAVPKRSNSVVVIDDVSEQQTNAYHDAQSATTKNDEQVNKQETATSLSWDFSLYEKLHVAELRQRLESRRCSTVGRKHVLIQRLVDVYAAELETLTVLQLRPVLKSKGCKQAGPKAQLIQRLVEAGI
jgi:hypothetical protein